MKYEAYSGAAVYVRNIQIVAPKVGVITKAVSTKCSSTTTKTVNQVDMAQTWWDHQCRLEPSLSIGISNTGWSGGFNATYSCSNVSVLTRRTSTVSTNYTFSQSNSQTTLWWDGQRQLAYGGSTCVDLDASVTVHVGSQNDSTDLKGSACISQTEAAN